MAIPGFEQESLFLINGYSGICKPFIATKTFCKARTYTYLQLLSSFRRRFCDLRGYKAHFDENDLLFERGAITLVPLPEGVTTADLLSLPSLYTVKPDLRKKARTVVSAKREEAERRGIDFGRTFSPTARP